MANDLRYALRSLAANPVFTVVCVLCLAFGIRANTAIFSLLDAALLRPLPVTEPGGLVVVETVNPSGRGGSSFSYPLYRYLREHGAQTADVFAYGRLDANLSAGAWTDAPAGLVVSDNYFSALGVRPAIGRLLGSPSDEAVVVLSYRYWQNRFDGDRSIAGRTVIVNGLPFVVAGVTPGGFFGTEVGRSPDIFVPLALRDRISPGATRLPMPNHFWLRVMGRLMPDVGTAAAAAQLQAAHQGYVVAEGGGMSAGTRRHLQQQRLALVPGARGPFSIGQQFGRPLGILMTAAGAVLLIACANVATLLLVRGTARRREIAIRMALGASRAQLMRQLLSESLLVTVAGSAAAVVLGVWSARMLTAFLADRVLDVALDTRLLAFTLFTSAVTAVVFGAFPAWQSARADVTPALKASPSGGAAGRRLGRLLIPAQVALSLCLLVGAGLFLRTLANLRTLDAGFSADPVVLATINPGLNRYTPEQVRGFYAALLDGAAGLPGAQSAAIADAPLLGGTFVDGLSVEGAKDSVEVSLRLVGPRFFETMGIRRLGGRDFSSADGGGAPLVAIINETIARRYFPGQDPIGKRIDVGGAPGTEIVGIVADTKYRDLRETIPNTVFVPLAQSRFASAERTLHVRTSGDPRSTIAAIGALIRGLDGTLSARVRPFSELVDATLERERLIAALCGVFAALALLLTCIGLYGVIAHGVARRTREIGIRLSLGARQTGVVWMVFREAMLVVSIGIAAGVPLIYWLSGVVRGQLFGVSSHDPATAAAAALVLLGSAMLACSVPARRASRVDPIVALRHE